MDGRRLLLIPLLIAAPALAGCVSEPLHIAYRVPDGSTVTLDASKTVEGTLLVERNATLILDHADLHIEQALLVEGRIEARDSRITFSGADERNELIVAGKALLTTTQITGASRVIDSGEAQFLGGSVSARCLDANGALHSENVAWTFPSGSCETFTWDDRSYGAQSGMRASGAVAFENGTLTFRGPSPMIRQDGGALRLGNLTLDGTSGGTLLEARNGDARLWGVRLLARDLAPAVRVDGAWLKLIDTPLPRNAQPPGMSSQGRLDVLWTLTVRAVSGLAQTPVPNATVTLTGAQDPTTSEAQGVTDARGQVRLLALEYRYDGTPAQERSGNPHMVRVDGKAGSGAAPAVVFEAPATVIVPIAGLTVVGPGALPDLPLG